MSTAANGNAAKVLEACRHFLGQISIADVVDLTGLTSLSVRRAFQTLVSRGLASWCKKGVYRLTPQGFAALVDGLEIKSGPRGPRVMDLPKTSTRTRVWRALRISRKGSIRELLTLASQGTEIDPEDVHKYLTKLTKAGYLTQLAQKGEYHQNRYLLIRDTGPKAPQWNKRQKRILDANTGEIHELA